MRKQARQSASYPHLSGDALNAQNRLAASLQHHLRAAGIKLLREALSVQESLDLLLASDPQREPRQVGIVDAKGNSATFTGRECQAWAGGRNGSNFAVQVNVLVSEGTVAAMEKAFRETKGMLGENLMRAFEEGQKAGGDSRGMQSAAILIVKDGAGYGGYTRAL